MDKRNFFLKLEMQRIYERDVIPRTKHGRGNRAHLKVLRFENSDRLAMWRL